MRSRIVTTLAILAMAVVQNPVLTISGAQTRQQPARTTGQVQPFINVEGADLKSKMEAATKLARSRPQQSPFWLGYSFDVRPGVAVDPNVSSFSGNMMNLGSVTLFIGSSAGAAVETRNLGVFMLIEPPATSIARLELYNLEQQREFGGYPVYWLGRSQNQESLDYLKLIAESNNPRSVAEHAAAAIGLHDAAQVAPILKELISKSSVNAVRTAAVFWLGFSGEHSFLAELARNERENREVREAAVASIGRGREAAVLPLLQQLYDQIGDREVKEQAIHSIAKNDNKAGAASFLLRIAKTDTQREHRESAVHMLGRLPGTQSHLAEIVTNEQESQSVREAAVFAISKSDDPKAISTLEGLYRSLANSSIRESIINVVSRNRDQASAMNFLVQIAKSDPSRELREGAVLRLGRLPGTQTLLSEIARNEAESDGVREAAVLAIARSGGVAAFSTLQGLFGSVGSTQTQEQILNAISKTEDREAALGFLIKVAEGDSKRELREQAINRLARFPSRQSLEALNRVATSDADVDLQAQAVMALGRRPSDEAVPLLIEIAKTHPRHETRELAIRRLGKSDDERAKEFFRQLLK